MNRKIKIDKKEYEVIESPRPHVLIDSKKELHGWWPWENRRECTAERLLINPYNGCEVNCWYCYALAFPGYFEIFRKENIIFVFKDFDKKIAEQLDSINVASCGYLSPMTDPFQKLNQTYKLSEKIINEFVQRNIPIEFVTKSKIPQEVIELIKTQKHSFGQVSILTINEKLRKELVPNGATTDELFKNLENMSKNNIYSVCRIDPIFPYITDKKSELKELVKRAKDNGAKHIIASILDIPYKIYDEILEKIKGLFGAGMKYDYKRLYTEKIGYINPNINYRKRIFDYLRNLCESLNLTFALCMEYEIKREGTIVGLNKEFSNSRNCEGMDVPLYIKRNGKFQPVNDCYGNCLNCVEPKCGIEELAMGKTKKILSLKLRDYKRWSRDIKTPSLFK